MKKPNLSFKKFFEKRKVKKLKVGLTSDDLKNPVLVKLKESKVDIITKYSALAAVLLAFFTILFDWCQTKDQKKVIKDFKEIFAEQLANAKKQKELTDSSINLLREQAERLKTQNEIWKIDQKNKIINERVLIIPVFEDYKLKKDSFDIKIRYSNGGERIANNFKLHFGVIALVNKKLSILIDSIISTPEKNIAPIYGFVTLNFLVPLNKRIDIQAIYIYTKFSYDDEMFLNPFVFSNFYKIYNKNGQTEKEYCNSNEIKIIERNSIFKNIQRNDLTIKYDYLNH